MATVALRSTGSDTLVVIDPGGPGFDPLAREGEAFRLLGGALAATDVAYVLEPWIQEPPDSSCLDAAASFVTALVDSGWETVDVLRPAAEQVRELCDLDTAALTEAALTETVNTLAADYEHVAFYAGSFGAPRMMGITARLESQPAWVLLDSPFSPAITGPDLVESRSLAVIEALNESWRNHCHEYGEGECDKTGYDVATDSAAAEPRYVDLAAIAGAIALDTNEAQLWDALTAPEASGSEVVNKLASAFLRRFGTGQIDPSLIGYWQGICPALSGWEDVAQAASAGRLAETYAAFHLPCLGIETQPTTSGIGDLTHVPVCIIAASGDTVTPAEFAKQWTVLIPGAAMVEVPEDQHGVGYRVGERFMADPGAATCRVEG